MISILVPSLESDDCLPFAFSFFNFETSLVSYLNCLAYHPSQVFIMTVQRFQGP